jgi:hypothetical protein
MPLVYFPIALCCNFETSTGPHGLGVGFWKCRHRENRHKYPALALPAVPANVPTVVFDHSQVAQTASDFGAGATAHDDNDTSRRHSATWPTIRASSGSARRPGGPRHGLPPKSSGSRAGRQGLSRCSVWTPQVAGWLSSPPPALPTGEGTSRFLKGCFQLIGTTGAGKDAPCLTGLFEYGRRLLKRGPTQAIAARLGRLSHGGIVMCRLTHG